MVIVGIRQDLSAKIKFAFPRAYPRVMTMTDALKAGELYAHDVPKSIGQTYPEAKRRVLALVPPGGCWRDLPEALARAYMQGSYFLGGGRTGMARRLSWQ